MPAFFEKEPFGQENALYTYRWLQAEKKHNYHMIKIYFDWNVLSQIKKELHRHRCKLLVLW